MLNRPVVESDNNIGLTKTRAFGARAEGMVRVPLTDEGIEAGTPVEVVLF